MPDDRASVTEPPEQASAAPPPDGAREQRIAAILESISDAFFALDRQWRFTWLNAHAETLLGRPRGALLGKEIWREFPEAVGSTFEREYRRAIATGERVTFEEFFPPLDGWFRVSAYPSPEGLSVYFQNINEIRSAAAERERLLAERDAERELLRTVLEQSPMGIVIAEAPSGRVLLANRQTQQIFGHARFSGSLSEYERDWVGYHGDGRPLAADEWPIARAIAHGEHARDRIVENARADGSRRTISINAAPVLDATGRIVAGVAIFSDVTEQRRAAQDLRLAREAAETANQAKSDFLATMSHEFRTPLNAFSGYLQLMEMGIAGPVTDQQREYLQRLHTSSQHLLGLVNDVLDLSKIDAGRMTIRRESVGIAGVVSAGLALLAPQAESRDVRIVRTPGASGDVTLVGDEDRVRQVLVNLLSNAVKFTHPGGAVTVDAGTAQDAPHESRLRGTGPWGWVRVTDTGIGVPPEQLEAIFEPFHQVETGHTRSHGGTGLGLAISRRLARLMDGDLTVESAPGIGSAFTLWLPSTGLTASGEHESARVRSARASLPVGIPLPEQGVAEIGTLLREAAPRILASYVERLRRDARTGLAREMRQSLIEDHAATLLGDVAQSLVILGDAGQRAAELLRDGSEIQRVIADRHGLRRLAKGWGESATRRDHELLREAVATELRTRLPNTPEAAEALRVVDRLMERVEEISVAAWRRCEADAAR